jgi:hypothetical protein
LPTRRHIRARLARSAPSECACHISCRPTPDRGTIPDTEREPTRGIIIVKDPVTVQRIAACLPDAMHTDTARCLRRWIPECLMAARTDILHSDTCLQPIADERMGLDLRLLHPSALLHEPFHTRRRTVYRDDKLPWRDVPVVPLVLMRSNRADGRHRRSGPIFWPAGPPLLGASSNRSRGEHHA